MEHRWPTRPGIRRFMSLVGALLWLGVAGCQSIGGRTVYAEFASLEGLSDGRPVYFAGVQIGTTGDPVIVQGKAQLPVHMYRSQADALPAGVVFAITEDPKQPGARCLQGYAVSSVRRREVDGKEIYQGVSNELELALIVGAEHAKDLWEALGK